MVQAQLATAVKEPTKVTGEKYLLNGNQGSKVSTTVEKKGDMYSVQIMVSSDSHAAGDLSICWGTYRTSPAKWFVPGTIKLPAGSSRDASTGGVVSKPRKAGEGVWELVIDVPTKLAPLFVAFQLQGDGQPELSRGGHRFAVPVGMTAGRVEPLGASLASSEGQTSAVNFLVRSRGAYSLSLILARRQQSGSSSKPSGCLEIALDPAVNRTGDLWHVCVQGLKDLSTLCWAWRADADVAWDGGGRFYPGQLMFDPYAATLASVQLAEGVNVVPPKKAAGLPSNPPATMGCLVSLVEEFDFGSSKRPDISPETSLVLEVDVASFTSSSTAQDEVPLSHQRKFLGLLGRLEAIRATGATAVMLAPVTASAAGRGQLGRAPISYFAPDIDFAVGTDPGAAARELRQVISGFHNAGLEVILQVEYCFTGEGSDAAPAPVSLRGLDAGVYYRSGSLLNCGHAAVRSLVVDSLRHWALHYDVDGFCFVNAETMAQDRHGCVLDNPPLAEEICEDPVLSALKLIAWSGDDSLLPRGGERGFPHWATWMQRNTRFSRDVSAFITGVPAAASGLATRITGSADLFAARWDGGLPGGLAAGRRPAFGLNGTTYLGKGTLWDQVASTVPEDAQPPAPGKLSQHETLAKTLLLLALVSQGVPTFPQDVLEDERLARALTALHQVRRTFARQLTSPQFETPRNLRWHGATPGITPDWDGVAPSHDSLYLAYSVNDPEASAVYVGFNPHHYSISVALPEGLPGAKWKRIVDTSFPAPHDVLLGAGAGEPLLGTHYEVPGKAAVVFAAAPVPAAAAVPAPRGPAAL
ncbi:g268 [Coccomyxa elongata]